MVTRTWWPGSGMCYRCVMINFRVISLSFARCLGWPLGPNIPEPLPWVTVCLTAQTKLTNVLPLSCRHNVLRRTPTKFCLKQTQTKLINILAFGIRYYTQLQRNRLHDNFVLWLLHVYGHCINNNDTETIDRNQAWIEGGSHPALQHQRSSGSSWPKHFRNDHRPTSTFDVK